MRGLTAYLLHLLRTNQLNGAALRQFTAALAKTHQWRGYRPPQANPVVADLFKGFQRLTAQRVNRLQRAPLLVPQALQCSRALLEAIQMDQVKDATALALVMFQFFTFARAVTAASQRTDQVACVE